LKFIEENAEEVLKSDSVTKLSKERLAVILASDRLNISELSSSKF